MNWNRDKNSWEEKAVNGEINCMLSFGGKFKQWIGVETRTLQQRKVWIEKYYCMLGFAGENLNNELESKQELFGRESCEWRNLLHVGLLGGGNLNNELESRQELFGRASCEWINLLHVELWGGKFKQWIGVETRTLRKRKLCIEKYYCMLGFGGKF